MRNLKLQKKIPEFNHLEQLQTLTGLLPPVPRLEDFVKRTSNCVELQAAKGGPILLFYCYKGENIAIARTFASAGTLMESHSHQEKIILIVYKGCIEITFNNKTLKDEKHILNIGASFEILPETEHVIYWLKDSWSFTISIPPTKGFPDG